MVAVAARKGIYDRLVTEDLVSFLTRSTESYDLFVATDVLVYLGGTGAPLRCGAEPRPARSLLYLFNSTESCGGEGYCLRTSGRYAHALGYLQQQAVRHGFAIVTCRTAGIRKEKGAWITGHLMVLRLAPAVA